MQLVILGTGAVGKSALTINFVKKLFCEEYDPTIEDSYSKQLTVDEKPVCLDILDTAGQEEYSAMRETYMNDGEGFVLVFAMNSKDSFEEIMEFAELIGRVKDVANLKQIPMVLLGNKCDLPEFEWEVTKAEAEELAERLGCSFLLTSAFQTVNVTESFETLVRDVRKARAIREGEADSSTSKKNKRKLKLQKACKML